MDTIWRGVAHGVARRREPGMVGDGDVVAGFADGMPCEQDAG